MSLLITGRTDMGLYPDGSVLSDPLGIGMILAVFHSEGKISLEMDMLNKVVSEGAMLAAVDFSIFAEIPSQPVALVASRLVNSSATDSSVQSSSLGQSAGSRSL